MRLNATMHNNMIACLVYCKSISNRVFSPLVLLTSLPCSVFSITTHHSSYFIFKQIQFFHGTCRKYHDKMRFFNKNLSCTKQSSHISVLNVQRTLLSPVEILFIRKKIQTWTDTYSLRTILKKEKSH